MIEYFYNLVHQQETFVLTIVFVVPVFGLVVTAYLSLGQEN